MRDPLEQIMPEDLAHYGIIPELIGRLPVISTLSELNKKSWLERPSRRTRCSSSTVTSSPGRRGTDY